MNVTLLRKIKRQILARPSQLNMDRYFSTWVIDYKKGETKKPGGCGTAGCIAGWALFFSDKKSKTIAQTYNTLREKQDNSSCLFVSGKTALALDRHSAGRLFFVCHWPQEFHDAYFLAATPREAASVTARRIDHFIKTKGAE